MKVTATACPGVLLLEPRAYADQRGWFFESFNHRQFEELTGQSVNFVQDNHSLSHQGVLRGLHYQIPAQAQGKLVRAVRGEIFDVAVDLRKTSPSFKQWAGVKLSAENRLQLWIPEGFAHGFQVLSETAEVLYKTTDYWSAAHERTVKWDDEEIGIGWPLTGTPILSEKDAMAPPLARAEVF